MLTHEPEHVWRPHLENAFGPYVDKEEVHRNVKTMLSQKHIRVLGSIYDTTPGADKASASSTIGEGVQTVYKPFYEQKDLNDMAGSIVHEASHIFLGTVDDFSADGKFTPTTKGQMQKGKRYFPAYHMMNSFDYVKDNAPPGAMHLCADSYRLLTHSVANKSLTKLTHEAEQWVKAGSYKTDVVQPAHIPAGGHSMYATPHAPHWPPESPPRIRMPEPNFAPNNLPQQFYPPSYQPGSSVAGPSRLRPQPGGFNLPYDPSYGRPPANYIPPGVPGIPAHQPVAFPVIRPGLPTVPNAAPANIYYGPPPGAYPPPVNPHPGFHPALIANPVIPPDGYNAPDRPPKRSHKRRVTMPEPRPLTPYRGEQPPPLMPQGYIDLPPEDTYNQHYPYTSQPGPSSHRDGRDRRPSTGPSAQSSINRNSRQRNRSTDRSGQAVESQQRGTGPEIWHDKAPALRHTPGDALRQGAARSAGQDRRISHLSLGPHREGIAAERKAKYGTQARIQVGRERLAGQKYPTQKPILSAAQKHQIIATASRKRGATTSSAKHINSLGTRKQSSSASRKGALGNVKSLTRSGRRTSRLGSSFSSSEPQKPKHPPSALPMSSSSQRKSYALPSSRIHGLLSPHASKLLSSRRGKSLVRQTANSKAVPSVKAQPQRGPSSAAARKILGNRKKVSSLASPKGLRTPSPGMPRQMKPETRPKTARAARKADEHVQGSRKKRPSALKSAIGPQAVGKTKDRAMSYTHNYKSKERDQALRGKGRQGGKTSQVNASVQRYRGRPVLHSTVPYQGSRTDKMPEKHVTLKSATRMRKGQAGDRPTCSTPKPKDRKGERMQDRKGRQVKAASSGSARIQRNQRGKILHPSIPHHSMNTKHRNRQERGKRLAPTSKRPESRTAVPHASSVKLPAAGTLIGDKVKKAPVIPRKKENKLQHPVKAKGRKH
ncbi:unnamed protein product [Cyclocybe aegerita]|uniref:Uncharacterized protein n=1 Tax=Cyclocybe aegerita TaxID=1973307 RepID=A0A8S0VXQ8_CYCAE|nr:unnamed protein product [Cyclocybe aegerita]